VDLRKFVQTEFKKEREMVANATRRESPSGEAGPARQISPAVASPSRLGGDELQSLLELGKSGAELPANLIDKSDEALLLPAALAPCSLFQQRAETSLRQLLDELAKQHENSLAELRSENNRLVDELHGVFGTPPVQLCTSAPLTASMEPVEARQSTSEHGGTTEHGRAKWI